jgi:hypothetical protein
MGSGSSPLSCGVFLPPPLLQALPLLIAGHVPPLLPSPAGLLWGISPLPLFSTQGALPSLLHVFLVVIAYYSVFFSFFPRWELVCPGGYADLAQGCLWEYHILLTPPCGPHLPKPSGHCRLAVAREPSWFLCLMWSGDTMRRLEVWRGQSFASSRWFFPVSCISSISPRFYFRRHAFCFLPLAAILESPILFHSILCCIMIKFDSVVMS